MKRSEINGAVRAAALVTRDRTKADGWVVRLRAAPCATDVFDRLLAGGSEELSGARTGADLGGSTLARST